MNKLPKDKRDKMILIGVGTLVVVGALWFLLINTQRVSLLKAQAEAAKSREQLEGGQRTVTSQAQAMQDFEAVSQALRHREATMASPNDMYLWHIEMLNKFRLGHKVEIPQFGREQMADVGVLPKFPYQAATFNVRGTAYFHDFGKFLADFENAFPYIRVQNLTLDPATAVDLLASGDSRDPRDGLQPREAREKLTFKMELLTLVRPNAL